ncbi:Thymidine kinase [Sesamum alatum]|uniref:Thymidine kinase n=1 Tax=Sesamum alatum TaxID=300844 RepID=A0AAE2CIC7_9LAMI|nr:Thymidine kinase [Sesamum alatum]
MNQSTDVKISEIISPPLSNPTAASAPLSHFFHRQPSVLRRTTAKIQPFKEPNFLTTLPVINSLANYSKPSSYSSKYDGLCTEGEVCSNNKNQAKILGTGVDSIVTHDGEKLPCLPLSRSLIITEKSLGAEVYDKLEVIGIDEAQFFEGLYDFCSKAADHDGRL